MGGGGKENFAVLIYEVVSNTPINITFSTKGSWKTEDNLYHKVLPSTFISLNFQGPSYT